MKQRIRSGLFSSATFPIDRRRLAVSKSPVPRVLRVGRGKRVVMVLDDFYQDPGYVRSLALSLDYCGTRGFFPGYSAAISIDTSPIARALRPFVDPRYVTEKPYDRQILFSAMSTRVDPARLYQPNPHVDGKGERDTTGSRIAAIVYLNTPAQSAGGTAFYRHRQTGLETAPQEITPRLARFMAKHRLKTLEDLQRWMLYIPPRRRPPRDYDILHGSSQAWEMLEMVEMKFNRLVMYPSHLFHAPCVEPGRFGDLVETCRLTQTFFLCERERGRQVERPAPER